MNDFKNFAITYDLNVIEQTNKLLRIKAFKDSKVRIMEDTHAGKGSVIGFTSTFNDKVIPNIVGVDIYCTMSLYKYKLHTKFNLSDFDNYVKEHIPSGMNVCNRKTCHIDLEKELICWNQFNNKSKEWILCSPGSIGSGNHFIELDKCNEQGDEYVYLVIHSGSRNLGKQVCEYYQKLAHENFYSKKNDTDEFKQKIHEIVEKYKSREDYSRENKKLLSDLNNELTDLRSRYYSTEIENGEMPPIDLEWLEGEQCQNYLHDMKVCEEFSKDNHYNMWYELNRFLSKYGVLEDTIMSPHNYIDIEQKIIRKGATDASLGKRLLIPMNMQFGTLVCEGLGNEDRNYSAPHGAGRLMSRNEAFKKLNIEDFQKSMEGIYTTTATKETLDEAPMVYKNPLEIIEGIKDTCKLQYIIKPIYNFKGNDSKPNWKK